MNPLCRALRRRGKGQRRAFTFRRLHPISPFAASLLHPCGGDGPPSTIAAAHPIRTPRATDRVRSDERVRAVGELFCTCEDARARLAAEKCGAKRASIGELPANRGDFSRGQAGQADSARRLRRLIAEAIP